MQRIALDADYIKIFRSRFAHMERFCMIDSQTGMMELLVHLLQYENLNITKIVHHRGMNIHTAYNCIELGTKLDLIGMREENPKGKKGGFKSKNYYLTEKGKKIAKKLKEIEEIIQG